MRYDSEGYRSDGRRQILGYSRAAQGGTDEARMRAEQRRNDSRTRRVSRRSQAEVTSESVQTKPKKDAVAASPLPDLLRRPKTGMQAAAPLPSTTPAAKLVDRIAPSSGYMGTINDMTRKARAQANQKPVMMQKPKVAPQEWTPEEMENARKRASGRGATYSRSGQIVRG